MLPPIQEDAGTPGTEVLVPETIAQDLIPQEYRLKFQWPMRGSTLDYLAARNDSCSYTTLRVEDDGDICIVTLNSPTPPDLFIQANSGYLGLAD